MTLSWSRTDAMVHNWAHRLGLDPHEVEWRVIKHPDGTFKMHLKVDSENGRHIVPFEAPLDGPTEFAVESALLSFRKRINPGTQDGDA